MIDREQIKKDLRAGLLPVREIARRAGCSVRTVYRIAAERERPVQARPEDGSGKTLSALIQALDGYYKTEV